MKKIHTPFVLAFLISLGLVAIVISCRPYIDTPIIVNEKYSSNDQIKSLLEGKNISVKSIENIVPSLEDVFIHLLEKK